jgi:hypothetical protein
MLPLTTALPPVAAPCAMAARFLPVLSAYGRHKIQLPAAGEDTQLPAREDTAM